ncbi:MAG: 3-phosphoglycerate dehydrogenase, partial [Clostridia bacterium]|nr:3-phosphoglycerate dehydrogenase [Clostridia bacterium]
DLLGLDNVTALPHLGASTPESEENCAAMAAVELREFLEKGTIRNSVNFPNVSLDSEGERVSVVHANTLEAVNDVLAAFTANGVETTGYVTKAKGDVAYSLIAAAQIPEAVLAALKAAPATVRVRKIG